MLDYKSAASNGREHIKKRRLVIDNRSMFFPARTLGSIAGAAEQTGSPRETVCGPSNLSSDAEASSISLY